MKTFALLGLLALPSVATEQYPAKTNLKRSLSRIQLSSRKLEHSSDTIPLGSQSLPNTSITAPPHAIVSNTITEDNSGVMDRNFIGTFPSDGISITLPAPSIAPVPDDDNFGDQGTNDALSPPQSSMETTPPQSGLTFNPLGDTINSESPSTSPSNSPSVQTVMDSSDEPSLSPSDSPSVSPSTRFSIFPSDAPSHIPSGEPSAMPSDMPSISFQENISEGIIPLPSVAPTSFGYEENSSSSVAPSAVPSLSTSDAPSGSPSVLPSGSPSMMPSDMPSLGFEEKGLEFSDYPSSVPSVEPSLMPSTVPSILPSLAPSDFPSMGSSSPSILPSTIPSDMPSIGFAENGNTQSDPPSSMPSLIPSDSPSNSPSLAPSASPSDFPSSSPSTSIAPSTTPSDVPSNQPSMMPSDAPSLAPSDQPSLAPNSWNNDFQIEGDFALENFYACSGSVNNEITDIVEMSVNYEYTLQLDEELTDENSDISGLVTSIEKLVLEAAMENTCFNMPADRRKLQKAQEMSASAAPRDFPYRSCGTYCYNMQGSMAYRLSVDDTSSITTVYCSALQAIAKLFQEGQITLLPHVQSAAMTSDSTICNIRPQDGSQIDEEPDGSTNESNSGLASGESYVIIGAFGVATAFLIIGGVIVKRSRTDRFEEEEEQDKNMAIHTLSTDEESGNNHDSVLRKDTDSHSSRDLLRSWGPSEESKSLEQSASWDPVATMGFSEIDLDDDSGYDDDYCLKQDQSTV